jgi:beta-N-acetylhexosaminidase
MIGHIAMPSLDAGDPQDPAGPPPAILSKKITTDFLRKTVGFDGLVISDAIEMNGSVSRVRSAYELIVKLVNAGNDQLLFCNAKRDFEILQKAVAAGDISLARIDEAVTRVLALKEKLGFAANPASARPAADPEAALAPTRQKFGDAARRMADKALTAVRSNGEVPLQLSKGDRVLVVHLRSNPEYNVDGFDELLRARGLVVDRHTEADNHYQLRSTDYGPYKAVLVLWTVGPTWGTGFIRPGGTWMRAPWFVRHEYPTCPMVHVSFGTPYLIHDVPWADTLLNAYSPDPLTQKAVVEWLFGEREATGTSPVDLHRWDKVRELIHRAYR